MRSKVLLQASPFVGFLFILPFTHTVAFRLLCLLLMLGVALSLLADKRKLDLPFSRSYFVWILVGLMSLIYSLDFVESLAEIKNEIGYTAIALGSFLLITRDQFHFRGFLITIAVSSTVLSLMVLYTYRPELANTYPNLMWDNHAPHGGAGDYSSYFTYTLPLLIYLIWSERKNPWVLAIATVMLPVIVLTVVWSHNRMFFVSLVVELSLLLWLVARGRLRLLIGLTFPAALLLGLGLSVNNIPYENDYSTKEKLEILATQDPRLKLWTCAGKQILSQPLSGMGFGRSMTNKSGLGECTQEAFAGHTHNFIIDAGVQMGIPGILALVWLLAAIARRFHGYTKTADIELKALGILGLVFLAGVISKNLTDYFLIRHHHLFFWSVIGMLIGYGEALKRKLP